MKKADGKSMKEAMKKKTKEAEEEEPVRRGTDIQALQPQARNSDNQAKGSGQLSAQVSDNQGRDCGRVRSRSYSPIVRKARKLFSSWPSETQRLERRPDTDRELQPALVLVLWPVPALDLAFHSQVYGP